MASTVVRILLVVGLMVVSWNEVSAQSGCTTAITSLAPCLSYVTRNSSKPSSSCCSQLASVVQTTPICLCSLLNGTGPSFALGITINKTQALQLPGACNVKTPSVNQCNAASGPTTSAVTPVTAPATTPVTAPAAAPAEGSSNETPDEAITPSSSTTPSQGSSKAVPSPSSPAPSGVSSIKVSLMPFIMSLILVGSYVFAA